MSTIYTLIIDTDQYSGNFERQMCAYITGQYGDCCVGEDEAQQAEEEVAEITLRWYRNHCVHRDDEDGNGCFRPCAIVPTPGRVNDGMGNHYDLATYKGSFRYPAYESVGIFLDALPSAELVQQARERAEQFSPSPSLYGNTTAPRILNVRVTKGVRKNEEVDLSTLR